MASVYDIQHMLSIIYEKINPSWGCSHDLFDIYLFIIKLKVLFSLNMKSAYVGPSNDIEYGIWNNVTPLGWAHILTIANYAPSPFLNKRDVMFHDDLATTLRLRSYLWES